MEERKRKEGMAKRHRKKKYHGMKNNDAKPVESVAAENSVMEEYGGAYGKNSHDDVPDGGNVVMVYGINIICINGEHISICR